MIDLEKQEYVIICAQAEKKTKNFPTSVFQVMLPISLQFRTNLQLSVRGRERHRLMGEKNRTASPVLEEESGFLCGSAPTMNVPQCASATCFCHRFALLSCLNLIGWRNGCEGWGRKLGNCDAEAARHMMESIFTV